MSKPNDYEYLKNIDERETFIRVKKTDGVRK